MEIEVCRCAGDNKTWVNQTSQGCISGRLEIRRADAGGTRNKNRAVGTADKRSFVPYCREDCRSGVPIRRAVNFPMWTGGFRPGAGPQGTQYVHASTVLRQIRRNRGAAATSAESMAVSAGWCGPSGTGLLGQSGGGLTGEPPRGRARFRGSRRHLRVGGTTRRRARDGPRRGGARRTGGRACAARASGRGAPRPVVWR